MLKLLVLLILRRRRCRLSMYRHYLQWHITHECNLHCRHCYQDDNRCVMPYAEMAAALDKYDEYIRAEGFEGQINLTGGEPLLHPDFYRIAADIRGRGMLLGILTNGTLIDDDAARAIAELKPLFVQVSLDGSIKVHDAIRGAGSFDKALRGIDFLKAHGVKVLVSFTVMQGNYREFKKVAAVCAAHKVDKLWWDRVVTDDATQYVTTTQFKEMSVSAAALAGRYPFISNSRALQWIPDDSCGYECSAGKRLLIILANGDMMPCRRLPFVIGNIAEVSALKPMLESNEIMKKLAAPAFPKGCAQCPHFYKCAGGARCVTYAQTGKLDVKDVNCYL